ncbi:YceI family protein [Azohydromonas caseinilytica]|uniref:YceI family protein n=1 Tax=Azohydromonas caseinilytica TaxID=2728836 RepID=A0A848F7X9_9BURK|nr:YceI family protein [Azohydromonas caseinilytica]NML15674.1 YceI family protein [Azohydromonas caseinilytica]
MKPDPSLPRALATVLALSALAACGPRSAAAPDAAAPSPAASVPAASSPGAALPAGDYVLDAGRSELAVLVRRGGALARLGHDHVVSHPALQGWLRLPAGPGEAQGEITVALHGLVVDEPALRARYALDTQPSAAAIEGTRQNMLQRVLQADAFPLARVRLWAAAHPGAEVQAEITLHGVTRRQRVPVDWSVAEGELRARGRLALLQSDFGIEPLSVLGGALRVEDRLDIGFELRAQAVPAAP